MTPFIEIDADGRILGSGTAAAEDLPRIAHAPGRKIIPGVTASPGTDVYFDTRLGRVMAMGARPGPHHVFDHNLKQWRLNLESAWAAVRLERNRRLAACDWVVMPDAPMADEQRTAWVTYRQALRDVTKQANPEALAWPAEPGPG